ncbi:XRE family transcriptional regulator [bacterium]|nr:XRE family transcriptional regulator [bacterium]
MYSGKRIRQARELHGWTQKQLADKIEVSQSAIAQIEGGFKEPSADLISDISRYTRFPLSFFSNDPLIEFDSSAVVFRAHATMTRRELVEAKRYAEVLYELFTLLAAKISPVPPSLPKSPSSDPQQAAIETRMHCILTEDGPIVNLIDTLERIGVLILALPVELPRRDAFSCKIVHDTPGDQVPLIAISKNRPADRMRLTIAHELGHLILGHKKRLGVEQEKSANQFAAEFLMPQKGIVRDFVSPLTLSRIAQLKPKWGVSIQALIRRAFDVRAISERQYRYLFEQLSANGWRMKEPESLDIPAEKPRLIRQMIEAIYGVPIDLAQLSSHSQLGEGMLKTIIEGYREKSQSRSKATADSNILMFRQNK